MTTHHDHHADDHDHDHDDVAAAAIVSSSKCPFVEQQHNECAHLYPAGTMSSVW